jgi:hypothetical protein
MSDPARKAAADDGYETASFEAFFSCIHSRTELRCLRADPDR